MAVLFFGLATARGEDPAFQALLVTRGKELTTAYQNCLTAFPVNLKEQLRIAQRAWIVFDNKNESAFAAVGKPRGMNEEDLDRAGLPETVARAEMLRTYFTGPNEDAAALRHDLDQAEQELTLAYKQSLAPLNREEEQKLREAERAWIEYRDKDMHAHAGDPSGRAQLWTSVRIARRRTTQLREFYLQRVVSLPTVAATPTTAAATPAPTSPRLSAAARAKLVEELHIAVQPVLAEATAGGTLTVVSTFDDVKEVPAALADDIATLSDKTAAFRQNVDNDDRREDCRVDVETADALVTLQKANQHLKAANAPAANNALAPFRQGSLTTPTSLQKPLWDYLSALRTLCDDAESQADTHLKRAKSAADAGHNGEALKEYQEAYKIYPDPETARSIKRLREDALGL